MIVATACRVDERKFVGFFFWTGFAAIRSLVMNLVVEEKEFAGQCIGYCFTALVASGFVWLPNCVLFITYKWIKESSENFGA